jgi:hypothetical protein
MRQFSSLLSWRLFTAQHVSGVLPPIIRSSVTSVAASGFTFVSWWHSCYVRGRADRPARPRTHHVYHHDTKVKPEAATEVTELLMMGGRTPETCWAVNKRQANKLENCRNWLVIYLNCTMMHGPTNLKSSIQFLIIRLISRSVGITANDFLMLGCRGAVFILQRTINKVVYIFLLLFLELGWKVSWWW